MKRIFTLVLCFALLLPTFNVKAESITDITPILASAELTDETVEPDKTYNLKLSFKETPERQFTDTPMVYSLPSGVSFDVKNSTFDIETPNGTIENNKIQFEKNSAAITLNSRSELFDEFMSLEDAEFAFISEVSFTEDVQIGSEEIKLNKEIRTESENDETQIEVKDNETQTEVKDNETQTEVRDNEIPKTSNAEEKPEETKSKNKLTYTSEDYDVILTGEFSENTKLNVNEITEEDERYDSYLNASTEKTGKTVGLQFSKILDITLTEDGKVTEPDDKVSVKISFREKLKNAEIVHFEGDKEIPQVLESETNGKSIEFETDSFSAYAIVSGPEPADIGLKKITSLQELSEGVFISHTSGHFFTNKTYKVNASRTGILKTPIDCIPLTDASKYYFESAADGKYYIYCNTSEGKKYVRNDNNNSLLLSATPVTAFTVEMDEEQKIKIHNGNWYWNMQGGLPGKGFCSYNDANDVNALFYAWTSEEVTADPYGLNNKTYGLMYYNEGNTGKALVEEENSLKAVNLKVLTKNSDRTDKLLVPQGSDLSMWTFEWVGNASYYISSGSKYLNIENGEVTLSDNPFPINIIAGSNDNNGKISLTANGYNLSYGGDMETGFIATQTRDSSSWLNLAEEADITPDYSCTYKATKVSVSDTEKVKNGAQVIVYTRIWNADDKKYETYLIDQDGSLIRCTETGDTIEWIGTAINTTLWNFTEYYYEGTTTSNNYYELQNDYSKKYIAPQRSGNQILSDNKIGINLSGRRYNEYYSSITVWDDIHYAYSALAAELVSGEATLEVGPVSKANDFYFALLDPNTEEDALKTVPTLKNEEHGITMKMVDFASRADQSNFLGDDTGGINYPPKQGLLSTNLGTDGYPTAVRTGQSLKTLYQGASTVDHLFIESTYNATGYYEYDSTQNFASLKSDGDFKVYEQLGTTDSSSRPSLQHGQFFPYNDLHENKLAKVNDKNLYTATTEELPDTDPRKYEQIYLVQSPNYQFGMEMSASFTQTPNGLDNWGHDIIYEFTGDDDFWLYVDGELVIDLGGIHSALPGNINFSTGDVSVNGEVTTLYEIFKSNYKSRNPDKTDEEVNTYLDGIFINKDGKYLFEDYSTHDLKIFFMERGGGASNLHTKFNLSSVRPGQVALYKELSGTEDPNFRFAEYGYQIFYQMQENGPYMLLDNLNGQNKHNVIYDRTNIPVKFTESYTPDGCTQAYEKVFFLTPEQTAIITIPTGAIRYKIVECGVDPQIYDKVQINEEEIQGISAENGRKDYGTSAASITERQRVVFNNHVKDNAERTLTFVKKLYDADDNPIENDNTGFDFRLYLGKETDTAPAPANTHDYYIKTPEGEYCKWNSQQQNFESIGKTDFSTLSETEKESITFQTSPNGAISKIPAGLQVEVRGLIIGTKYKIEEREAEIPEGYSFIRYKDNEGNNTNAGSIKAGEDPSIEIHNRKGYGLTVKKQWSDTDYVNSHDNIFFGIYVGDTLVEDTVKCFSAADKYKYWYFDSLQDNKTLSDYLIKEVKLSGNYTIENGNVRGNFTAVPVDEGNLITVGATLKNDTRTEYDYSASYRRDTDESSADNVRTDMVTNTRRGIKLIKTDFNGNPLQNAVFTLKDDEGNVIGGNSYTSDASGLITIAYIRDNKVYTLEETKAPKGYVGAGTIKFKKSNGIVTVTEGNDYQVVQTQGEHDAEIRIKNKPFELKVVKKGFSEPLEGAGFELYKEIISGGTPFIDFTPMDGYTNLVSNSAGVIPKVNETLDSGTYYLKETSAPAGYEKISQPVRFVISETGQVTVNENSEVALSQVNENNVVKYTITITDKEQTVIPTGIRRNGILIMLILAAAMYLFLRKRTPGVFPEDRNNSF